MNFTITVTFADGAPTSTYTTSQFSLTQATFSIVAKNANAVVTTTIPASRIASLSIAPVA